MFGMAQCRSVVPRWWQSVDVHDRHAIRWAAVVASRPGTNEKTMRRAKQEDETRAGDHLLVLAVQMFELSALHATVVCNDDEL